MVVLLQSLSVVLYASYLMLTGVNPALALAQTAGAGDQLEQDSSSSLTYLPLILTGKMPRGYLTTPPELSVIKAKKDQGLEPYRAAVEAVLVWANLPWDYPLRPAETCESAELPAWTEDSNGIPKLYARALAYHLTGEAHYAEEVKDILQRIMTEVHTISVEEHQCRLNFSWATPELVASADLIENYWVGKGCTGPLSTLYTDITISQGDCKILFQNWLVKNPYFVTSLSAEGSQSNWGAAATNTLAYIADYLWDRQDVTLIHRVVTRGNQNKDETIRLTPGQAYAHANQLMLKRINGYGIEYHSSSCSHLSGLQQSSQWTPVKSQITENGIIPDDARRQEYCNIPHYNGQYQNYPQIHLGNNIQQCELMLRRGDRTCYDNIDNTDLPNYSYEIGDGTTLVTHLRPGRGSIERAINAIIVDSNTEWRHDSALAVAYRYYYNHHKSPSVDAWSQQLGRIDVCAQHICFGMLTHGFAPGETSGLPPVTSP